ncbi:GntR family transcriptional regulator [Gemmobacter fulvus]|uniref:GntR family transcriptional regulator n=1 Tax=Gemmobacter fulvus TaxID=2840474 RepID=UPI002796CFDA|nr:GntR family transcriptional regulator [Gemmobacter fulvus]MDQ1850675.1 GntR family transcriptional regulator [Gemmobacter fulvus]
MATPDNDDLLELEPIARHILHEQILNILKRKIMMGGFAPGQKLPLRALAKSLDTSLMPVRCLVWKASVSLSQHRSAR